MNADPVITVVVPVFNTALFIGDCLRSILRQNGVRTEIIVIDGGSTDGSREVIEGFQADLAYWASEADDGQTHALNKGFDCATGDILCWLNADEEYLPGALSAVADAFLADPDIDFVFGDRVVCDATGVPLHTVRKPRMHPKRYTLYCGGVYPSDATFWSARAHRAAGGLDAERFAHLAMDYDWFLRLSPHVKGWVRLDRQISLFKNHNARKTTADTRQEVEKLWTLARARFRERHGVGSLDLAAGWLYWGMRHRAQLGDVRLPRASTLYRLLARAPH